MIGYFKLPFAFAFLVLHITVVGGYTLMICISIYHHRHKYVLITRIYLLFYTSGDNSCFSSKVDEGKRAQQKHINHNKKLANRCIALKFIMDVWQDTSNKFIQIFEISRCSEVLFIYWLSLDEGGNGPACGENSPAWGENGPGSRNLAVTWSRNIPFNKYNHFSY